MVSIGVLYAYFVLAFLPGCPTWGDGILVETRGCPDFYRALVEYDKPALGGNGDDFITAADAVFSSLRLWQDANHNGISEASELKTLAALKLTKIECDYKESKRTDEFGNQFRYRAKVKDAQGSQLGRWAWDVFLVAQ